MKLAKWAANGAALFIGIVIAIVLSECFLSAFHPFAFRLRGTRILLPKGHTYVVENRDIPGLDATIIHTKNSLGFRGAEPPLSLDGAFSILTSGGSTTECFYLSDGTSWPELVANQLSTAAAPPMRSALWLNNAGMDGMSTFGLLRMMKEIFVPIRPNVILFMVGLNDIGFVIQADTKGQDQFDHRILTKPFSPFLQPLAEHSELVNLGLNLARYGFAARARLTLTPWELGHRYKAGLSRYALRDRPDEWDLQTVTERYRAGLEAYRARLAELVELARESGIQPMFITQSTLWGCEVDPNTGIDLRRIGGFCHNHWVLQAINNTTRSLAESVGLTVIDLAAHMPHDSSLFYDEVHFNKRGAQRVAGIVGPQLVPLILDSVGNLSWAHRGRRSSL